MSGLRRHHQFPRRKWERRAGTWALFAARALLVLTLCGLPLIWGGRTPEGWGLAGLAVLASACCWVAGLALRGEARFYAVPGCLPFPVLLIAGLCQLSPEIAGWCAPESTLNYWHQAEQVLGTVLSPSVAVLPEVHRQFLLMLAMAGLFFLLLCQLFRTRREIFFLTAVVLMTAAVGALAGIVQYISGSEWVFWLYKGKAAAASGYYANKNHFAMLQEFGIFSGLGLIISMSCRRTASGVSRLPGRWRGPVLYGAIAATVCCLLGLGLSYSRAGIFCTLTGLGVLILYVLFVRRTVRHPALIAGIVLLALLSFPGIDSLLYRLELALSGEDASGLIRYEMWRAALKLIPLSPWIGLGFGGFRFTSPALENAYVPGKIFFYAHNDFLELAVSVGLPVTLLVLALLVWRGGTVLRGLLQRRSSSWSYLGTACLTGILVAGGHEFFDYGLQCSANLLIFCTLSLIAARCAFFLREYGSGSPEVPGREPGRFLYAVPCCCVILVLYCLQPYWKYWKVGERIAYINSLSAVPELRAAYSFHDRQRMIIHQSGAALTLIPDCQDALDLSAMAYRRSGFAEFSEISAAYISRRSMFPVSASQIWSARYRPELIRASRGMTRDERRRVAFSYAQAVSAYSAMLRGNPADALILAVLARSLDDVACWTTGKSFDPAATPLYARARALYPCHGEVSLAASGGYWRRLSGMTPDDPGRDAVTAQFRESLQAAMEQLPQSMARILRYAWNVWPDQAAVERITPATIQGQEALYALLNEQGRWQGALAALRRMETLNRERPPEETPESMGIFSFLRREQRSPQQVALRIAEAAVPLCRKLGDAGALAEWEKKLLIRRQEFFTPQIARVDTLMKNGEYRLAEEVLKKLDDDPRALLRYAQIAYLEQRMELYSRLMVKLKDSAKALNSHDKIVYQSLHGMTEP